MADPGIDWAAEAQAAVDAMVKDVLTLGPAEAAKQIERRMLGAQIEPMVAACMCVETAGLLLITLQVAAGMLDRPAIEFFDEIQRWRGVTTTAHS